MNNTQQLYAEVMDELTQYLAHDDAKYFAKWLLTNYKCKKYDAEDTKSVIFINEHDYPIT